MGNCTNAKITCRRVHEFHGVRGRMVAILAFFRVVASSQISPLARISPQPDCKDIKL